MFAVFEREGDKGLAVECIPLDEMRVARRWGEETLRSFLEEVDKADD